MERLNKGKQLFKFKTETCTAKLEQLLSSENFEQSLQHLKPELLYGRNTEYFSTRNATYMIKAVHDCSVLDDNTLKINLIEAESKEK